MRMTVLIFIVASVVAFANTVKICRDCGPFGYCIRKATTLPLLSFPVNGSKYYHNNHNNNNESLWKQQFEFNLPPAALHYNPHALMPYERQQQPNWHQGWHQNNGARFVWQQPWYAGHQPWWVSGTNSNLSVTLAQSANWIPIHPSLTPRYRVAQEPWWLQQQRQQWQMYKTTLSFTTTMKTIKIKDDSGDECAECACPSAVGGRCCEEVPDLCSEVQCATVRSNSEMPAKSPRNKSSLPPDIARRFVCRQLSAAQNFYACDCEHGLSGERCDMLNACTQCSVHGTRTCSRVTNASELLNCECRDGFIGRFCENKMFEFCADGECDLACEETNGSRLCKNGGLCFYNGTAKYFCRCADGYTGVNCEKKILCGIAHKNPCQHGGICVPELNANYTCQCPDIWIGDHCQYFNVCTQRQPCKNGGRCIPTGHNAYMCDCRGTGFDGDLCNKNVDDCADNESDGRRKCQHRDTNATCIDGVNSFTCTCSHQYRGRLCDIPVTTWTFLENFPDVSESEVAQFMEMMASGDEELESNILPFLTSDVEQKAFSWTREDLFIWASFQSRELNVTEEFAMWNDPLFGNCFTFNHPNTPQSYITTGAGSENGFEALLRVREDEYLPWTATAGIALFFHTRDERVFTDSARFYAAPRTGTQFALSKVEFTRLGGVYGDCVNEPNEVHSYYYDGVYTVEGCIQSCYQNAVHLMCGCTDPRYPGIAGVVDCTLTKGPCVLNVTLTLGDPSEWKACECTAPCNKTDFRVDVRAASLIDTLTHDKTGDTIYISVYFAKDYILQYNELASMDFNRYISFFGGVVGVVAGFSVISVVEFGFLVYRLLLTFCTNESVSLDEAEVQDVDDDIII